MAQRPGVSVDLIPIEQGANSGPQVDVRILWVAPGDEPRGLTQAPLFHEQVFPVCSPQLLPDGEPLRDAQSLASLPLLHKADHGMGEWSWPVWLERLGVRCHSLPASELRFAEMGLVLSAAVEGAGVALSRSLLVHDAIQSRRLMVPLQGIAPMASTKRHVARWASSKASEPDIRAFVEWLSVEARKTLDEVASSVQEPGLNVRPLRARSGAAS